MVGKTEYTGTVSLKDYIKSCETVEEALGISSERMQSLNHITTSITQGCITVAEALHAIATYTEFSEYERTYVTFKFTESINHTLESTTSNAEGYDMPYKCLEEGGDYE